MPTIFPILMLQILVYQLPSFKNGREKGNYRYKVLLHYNVIIFNKNVRIIQVEMERDSTLLTSDSSHSPSDSLGENFN